MNFKESISTCLSEYAVFTGRAVKSEFYWWPVFLLLILIIVGAINAQLSRLLIIIMIIPTLAVTTRRLHDMNFSGWWQLAYLFPPLGIVLLMICCTQDSADPNILSSKEKMNQLICTNCGTVVTDPKTATKGHFLFEVILWLCFIVPGMLYTIWRLTTRAKVCHSCGSANLVSLDSPVGKRLYSDFNSDS